MSFDVIRNIDVQLLVNGLPLGEESRQVIFTLSIKSVRLDDDGAAVATVSFYYDGAVYYIKDYNFSYDPEKADSIFQQAEAAVKDLEPETVI